MREYESGWKTYPVVGIGEGNRNRPELAGVPYVEHYDHDGDYSWNANNYIREDTAFIVARE